MQRHRAVGVEPEAGQPVQQEIQRHPRQVPAEPRPQTEVGADREGEVRALLEYCGLPFDPACLRFFENERPVRTASSEQVRQPIYKEGVDQWRHYEPWLGDLRTALGPVLDHYPDAPPLPDPAG